MCCPVLRLLKVAVDCHRSGLPLPIKKYPVPVFVIVNALLKVLLPIEPSFVEPFFIEITFPPKLQPLNNKVGLTVATFPPNAEVGPKVKLLVPVNVRLCAVAPTCVKRWSNNVPEEKPPAPTEIVLPAANVAVAAAAPQNWTP